MTPTKPEDALVEKTARAICEQDGYDPDRLEPGDDPYHEEEGYPSPCIDGYNRKDEPCHFVWRRYDKQARAALEASGITTLLERERRATEALTPGAGTKGAYIGEFSFTIDEDERQVDVPWTTIKEIMAAIKARAALTGENHD